MGLGDWFGKGRLLRKARERELAHDTDGAIALYLRAGAAVEASRVKLTLAEANRDPTRKLLEFAQAIELAPDGSEARRNARRARALFLVDLHSASGGVGAARAELERAAAELIEVDEGREAAKAYRLLGDRAGEARALEAAGAIEELELLFAHDDEERNERRAREQLLQEVRTLHECGKRREALAQLASQMQSTHVDPRVVELAGQLRQRRLSGPSCEVEITGKRTRLVFGREAVLGRSDADLIVNHSAISRRHLGFRRAEDGSIWVRDLGSRNGTQRGGLPLAGEMPIGAALQLTLGREVPLELHVTDDVLLEVKVAGTHATLVLGDELRMPYGWTLSVVQEWLELRTPAGFPAYLDGLMLASPATLLQGDRITCDREDTVALVI